MNPCNCRRALDLCRKLIRAIEVHGRLVGYSSDILDAVCQELAEIEQEVRPCLTAATNAKS
jgi:hypothetical protein